MLAAFGHIRCGAYSRHVSALKPRRRWATPNLLGPSRYRTFSSSSKPIPPEGSWDSHVHIIDPIRYPFAASIKPPKEATMRQALENADRLGLPNMVFVQLSTYGNDNTWVLVSLKETGPARGRGVVAFDPERVELQTLKEWHDLGVRGVRVNLRSSKTVLSKSEIQNVLRKYAEKLRPLETWSIGLYADMEVLDHVQPLIPELQVNVVLEHFGSPAFLPLDPSKQPGWDALCRMMEDPSVYVKLSAPYLFSTDANFSNLESLAKALFRMRNGAGVVFGSDWPHTKSRGWDAKPFVEKVVEWCDENEELREKLFRGNARELWDIE
ncbi:2-pyrone-4,6-dicarbaxylate hydrolase [Colletotrichum siamense]|nr:2-pyrone-4,6-dicarbaxylate hydrolase [Colletotrichum siamense]